MNAELLKYHKNKLDYHKTENALHRNSPKWAKTGSSKPLYDKIVLRHRREIKFHQRAILYLEGVQ